MGKKKPLGTWVEQIGETEAANKNPSIQEERVLGGINSASTTVVNDKSLPDEVFEKHLEKGKEQTGKPSQAEVRREFDHDNWQKNQDERIAARDHKTSHYPDAPKVQQSSKLGGLFQKAKSFIGDVAKFGGKGVIPVVGTAYSIFEAESVGDGTLDGPLGKEKEQPDTQNQEPENQEKSLESPQQNTYEPHSENKVNDPSQNQPETPEVASGNESRAESQQLSNDEKSRVLDLLRDDKPLSFNDSQVAVPDLSDKERNDLMTTLNAYAPDKSQFLEYYADRNEPGAGKEEQASKTEERNEPSQYPNDKEAANFSDDGNESRTVFQENTSDEKSRVLDLLRDDKPFSFNDSQVEVTNLSDDDREELMIALNEYTPDKPDLEELYPDREISHNELSEDFLSGRDMPLGDDDGDDGGSDGGGDD